VEIVVLKELLDVGLLRHVDSDMTIVGFVVSEFDPKEVVDGAIEFYLEFVFVLGAWFQMLFRLLDPG
jgi:hypothetical protein